MHLRDSSVLDVSVMTINVFNLIVTYIYLRADERNVEARYTQNLGASPPPPSGPFPKIIGEINEQLLTYYVTRVTYYVIFI